MGANPKAGKNPSILFPFAPEQPWVMQVSLAQTISSIHRPAMAKAMNLSAPMPTITTNQPYRLLGPPGG